MSKSAERTIHDLVYVGLNGRVVAVDRYSGEIAWQFKAPKGTGYVSLLVDADRLLMGVGGYAYCLDPIFGQVVWSNPLKGFGTGITSMATVRGSVDDGGAAAEVARQQAAAAAAAAAT